jgi:hypothetical protein
MWRQSVRITIRLVVKPYEVKTGLVTAENIGVGVALESLRLLAVLSMIRIEAFDEVF